jgi:RNA polymerase sigma-70 factor (ECF subfamily)
LPDHSAAAPISAAADAVFFDREWALGILECSLDRIRHEFEMPGQSAHFAMLQHFLPSGVDPVAYEEAARELGMTVGALKSEVHRLRRHFRSLVREEVALTVSAPHEIDEEMAHLQRVLQDRGNPLGSAKLPRTNP